MSPTLHRQSILESENQILAAVAQGTPTRVVLNKIVETLEAISGDVLGSILGLRAETRQLHILSAPSLPKGYNEAIEGLVIGDGVGSCGTAAFRGTPIVVEDILQHPFWKDFKDVASEHGLRACWSTPILSSRQEVLGTFACYYREPKLPTDLEWELISRLGHLAAIAIERESNQAQRQSKPHLDQIIVENAAVAILIVSKEGKIVRSNPQCSRLLGFNSTELRGKDSHELLADQADVSGLFSSAPPITGTTQRVEQTLVTRSGDHLDAELHITKLADESLLILANDQGQRPSTEASQHKNPPTVLLEKLAAAVAEQINQPLASIAGHRDLIASQLPNHPDFAAICQSSLHQISIATQQAAEVTGQLLAFAKQSSPHSKNLDITELFSSALLTLRQNLGSDASIDLRIKPGVKGVWADPDALSKVLLLLALSGRTSESPAQEFILSAEKSDQPNRVIVTLKHTRSDFTEQDERNLFEPFRDPLDEGFSSGLDLATVRSMVAQMQGTISASITPHQSVTFKLGLPTEPLQGEQPEPANSSEAAPIKDSILICEDNEAIRLAVEGLLRASGFDVLVAANAEEALEITSDSTQPPAVLVSDIRMPGLDGKELSLKLRESYPNLQIILISGHTGGLVTDEWLRREKIAFLAKPFSHQALIQAVSKAYNDYQQLVRPTEAN